MLSHNLDLCKVGPKKPVPDLEEDDESVGTTTVTGGLTAMDRHFKGSVGITHEEYCFILYHGIPSGPKVTVPSHLKEIIASKDLFYNSAAPFDTLFIGDKSIVTTVSTKVTRPSKIIPTLLTCNPNERVAIGTTFTPEFLESRTKRNIQLLLGRTILRNAKQVIESCRKALAIASLYLQGGTFLDYFL